MKKKPKILRKFPALEKGELFIVSAPSGAGKTTMCRKLSAVVPRLKHSISCTTRVPRKGEVRNVHYSFISKEKFRTMIKKEEFAEWAVVHGNLYGTPIKRLIQITKKGYDVILDIDTQGAMQMRRRFKNAVYIFILPPSMKILEKRLKGRRSESTPPSMKILEKRLKGRRSKSTPEMKKRLERAKEEIADYKNYDYIVVNDDFKKALRELESIIMSKRLGVAKVDPEWIKNLK